VTDFKAKILNSNLNDKTLWDFNSPTHPLNGSPVKPSLQVQKKLPTVSVHRAFSLHGLSSHSFTSENQTSYLYYCTPYILAIAACTNQMAYRQTDSVALG
jgi:hypothetical protein